MTIHFAGKRGRKIRERYMAMSINSFSSDSHTAMRPVLPELTSNTRSYTFREPRGLIFSTQFTQPSITILEKVTFETLREKCLIQEGAPFAGHSLGEYGVLSAMVEVMPFESFMDVVFYRGLAMQMALDRTESGETAYGMMAVNPSRISPGTVTALFCKADYLGVLC